jgi:hypothetical protein
MIDHLLVVAGNEHRLPPGQRRAFFDRIVAQYRRRLPEQGYPVPGGMAGLKHRLVRRNAYLGYAGLRLLWRAVGARQRPAGPAGAAPAAQPASLPAR